MGWVYKGASFIHLSLCHTGARCLIKLHSMLLVLVPIACILLQELHLGAAVALSRRPEKDLFCSLQQSLALRTNMKQLLMCCHAQSAVISNALSVQTWETLVYSTGITHTYLHMNCSMHLLVPLQSLRLHSQLSIQQFSIAMKSTLLEINFALMKPSFRPGLHLYSFKNWTVEWLARPVDQIQVL